MLLVVSELAILQAIYVAIAIHCTIYVALSPFGSLVLTVACDITKRFRKRAAPVLDEQDADGIQDGLPPDEVEENAPPQMASDSENPYASGNAKQQTRANDKASLTFDRGMGICFASAFSFAVLILLVTIPKFALHFLNDSTFLFGGGLLIASYALSLIVKTSLLSYATKLTFFESIISIFIDQLLWIPVGFALSILNTAVCSFAGIV